MSRWMAVLVLLTACVVTPEQKAAMMARYEITLTDGTVLTTEAANQIDCGNGCWTFLDADERRTLYTCNVVRFQRKPKAENGR